MLDWVKPGLTYKDMVAELARFKGDAKFPVITRADHSQQWREWYAYYGFRRLRASQELMRQRDEKTVPTMSPFDFDAEFQLAKPAPDVPRDKDEGKRAPPTEMQRFRAKQIMDAARWGGKLPTDEAAE